MFELVGPRQITDIGDVVKGTRLYELIGEFSPFRNNLGQEQSHQGHVKYVGLEKF